MEGLVKMPLDCYSGSRVLVTGHTGFKGSWLCEWLLALGAEVHGYALPPPTKPSLFNQLRLAKRIKSHIIADVCDLKSMKAIVKRVQPSFIFHLAAQPIVRFSYAHPVETFETNVMGTVNLLECVRGTSCVRSVLNVTTDKVYHNNEWCWGYREDEPLDGFDPYSNSKSCSELVTHSYINSFFDKPDSPAVSTAVVSQPPPLFRRSRINPVGSFFIRLSRVSLNSRVVLSPNCDIEM